MRAYSGGDSKEEDNFLFKLIMDNARTVFQVAVFASLVFYVYLCYGLFTGQLAGATALSAEDKTRVLDNIRRCSALLDFSIVVTVVFGIVTYYETIVIGYVFLAIWGALGYGIQFCIDYFFASETVKYTQGMAAEMTLQQIAFTGLLFGIPGAGVVLFHIGAAIRRGRFSRDLTVDVSYGKDAKRERRKQPLIPAIAPCWELPFCRESLRPNCPIYKAGTRCWREKAGCMCEENIIKLATIGEKREPTTSIGAATGFVPLSDLIADSEKEGQKTMTTRKGPRGVRIPTNPHLTERAKRERCRNCIIYNEHQRYKYQIISPVVTLAVPLLAWLNFGALEAGLGAGLSALDHLVANISFAAHHGEITSQLTKNVTSSFSVTVVLIICGTLVAMTWALRFLEYCVFKIKI